MWICCNITMRRVVDNLSKSSQTNLINFFRKYIEFIFVWHGSTFSEIGQNLLKGSRLKNCLFYALISQTLMWKKYHFISSCMKGSWHHILNNFQFPKRKKLNWLVHLTTICNFTWHRANCYFKKNSFKVSKENSLIFLANLLYFATYS